MIDVAAHPAVGGDKGISVDLSADVQVSIRRDVDDDIDLRSLVASLVAVSEVEGAALM